MSRAEIEEQFLMVVDGAITFDRAARATMSEWRRMASGLVRRWRPPAWYGADDVLQELLLQASIWIWRWDSYAGGAGIARFTCWNAAAEAKRALHAARGAVLHGTAGKNPSRFERPFSSLSRQGAEEDDDRSFIDGLLRVEASAEVELAERDERLQAAAPALAVCVSGYERAAIVAMAEAGSIDGGVALLYEKAGMRVALGITGRDDAEQMVNDTARAVARRLAARAEF